VSAPVIPINYMEAVSSLPMSPIQIILLPFSAVYAAVMWLRNKLFDANILPSTSLKTPKLIGVGNLSVGGTGKSPHVEYIVKLLQNDFKVATLSRGYGRTTTGFRWVTPTDTADQVGDEPLQFRFKFPESCAVAVDENRVHGVHEIVKHFPQTEVIVLDDVFQHRKIQPHLQILLTDYNKLFTGDWVLPAGRLREPASGKNRADVVVVTKCPETLSAHERIAITKELALTTNQALFFSKLHYGELRSIVDHSIVKLPSDAGVIILSGIANPAGLDRYIRSIVKVCEPVTFPDHHLFTDRDIEQLLSKFESLSSTVKFIITTEKDAVRLQRLTSFEKIKSYTLVQPIEVKFEESDETRFNQIIYDLVRNH